MCVGYDNKIHPEYIKESIIIAERKGCSFTYSITSRLTYRVANTLEL